MPYTEASADLFFGRDQDILLIANNARAYPLSILYGPSGVGKTSVLQAGVLRHIRDENARRLDQYGAIETVVAYTSEWRDEPQAMVARVLKDAFVQAVGSAPDSGPERLDPDAILQFCSANEVDLLLILDQFEEFFLYHQDSAEAFADELARLLRPGARVSVLLSIREDALARLDEFGDAIPGVFDNTLRLEHLDEESARSTIIGPLRHHNELVEPEARREIEPALVDALIEEVQAGRVRVDHAGGHGVDAEPAASAPHGIVRVEAPYLQLVLIRLWDEETRRGSLVLQASTLRELGGAQEIVRQHLDRVVHLFSAEELHVMVDAFGHLVTPSGSKIAHTASDLAALTSHDPDVVRSVLRRLCRGDQFILREVPGPLNQPEAEPRFEIFHDVLALAVLDWRRRWLSDATATAQQAQLVAAKEEAELQTREAHRRLRRARLVVSGLGLLVGACLVLAVLALNARDEASRNAALDDVNKQLASDPSAALATAARAWKPNSSAEYEDAFRTALDAADTEVKLVLGSPLVESFFVSDKDLVTVSEDGYVRLWRGRTVRDRFTLTATPGSEADVTHQETGDKVISAALAGDRRYVVVSTDGGNAYRVELATGEVRKLATSVNQMSVEAPPGGGGSLVMLNEYYGRTSGVYDVTTLTQIELPDFEKDVWGAAFDRTGRYLATFATNSEVRVWDLTSRRLVKFARVRGVEGDNVELIEGDFTSTGEERPQLLLIVDAKRGELHTWDVLRRRAPVFLDSADSVWDTDANGNGSLALAALKSVLLYLDGSYVDRFADKKDYVTQVQFDPADPLRFALGARTGEVELYDTAAHPLWRFHGHRGPINSLAFSPDGRHLVTASSDDTVRVWRMPDRKVLWRSDGWAMGARYTPDGRYLVGADVNGNVVRIDRSGSSTKPKGFLPKPWLKSVDPAPSGSAAVFVPYSNADTPQFATFDGSIAPALTPSDNYLTVARWSPDMTSPQIAGGTERNTLVLWEPGTGAIKETVKLGDLRFAVKDVAYSKDGSRIVAISEDGGVRVVRAADGRIERRWTAPRSSSVDISSDGRYVVTAGDDDQKVRVWDTDDLKAGPVHVLTQARGRGFTNAVTLSPDDASKRVAITTAEGLTYIWDRQSGRLLAALRRHADFIKEVAFDPQDINHLVSASDDQTISSYTCNICQWSAKELAGAARARLAQVVTVTKPRMPEFTRWTVGPFDFDAAGSGG